MLLINPGTPASDIGQKVTTLLSKGSGQTIGAVNMITYLHSHPRKFVSIIQSLYTYPSNE